MPQQVENRRYTVAVEKDVRVPMRDGTILRADVYHPEGKGRYPTIVTRTAYNKSRIDTRYYEERGYSLAERGYTFVAQDIRGTYASEGDFFPCTFRRDHHDTEDGYDTIEWAARLPWSTGKVGTVGSSYDGWTQWELAHARPPHLAAMMPQAIAASTLDQEMSGVLRLGQSLQWFIVNLAPDQIARDDEPWGPRNWDDSRRLFNERDRDKWTWFLPLMEIPDHAMHGLGHHWRKWLGERGRDNFDFLTKLRKIEAPAFITTSWFDQQVNALKLFSGMSENAASETARAQTRIMVGPWRHTGTDFERTVGKVDFGPEAERDFYQVVEQWFGHWLKGEDTGLDDVPRAQLFVMGANRWRYADEWPLPETRYTDYYFHSDGNARTIAGDGLLSREAPGESPPNEYVYDPRDPVMTIYPASAGSHEPADERPLDGRQDVLVFQTPPLEEDVEVTGNVVVKLWAASSAPDTDFTAKLVDVWPDGFSMKLCYGIVRARFRESYDSPTLIEPGRVYEYTIALNPTSNLFERGHRIRVDISSSDFPNFDRNHNTGGNDYAETTLKSAHQTVFHDPARPSRVILPVIPR